MRRSPLILPWWSDSAPLAALGTWDGQWKPMWIVMLRAEPAPWTLGRTQTWWIQSCRIEMEIGMFLVHAMGSGVAQMLIFPFTSFPPPNHEMWEDNPKWHPSAWKPKALFFVGLLCGILLEFLGYNQETHRFSKDKRSDPEHPTAHLLPREYIGWFVKAGGGLTILLSCSDPWS